MFEKYESIMVLVPHQDDEVLMAAGVIRSAVKRKAEVEVVMVTNGDYGCRDFSAGRERLRESVKGLEILGLSREHFHILGYADTGMPAEESFLTRLYEEEDESKICPSFCAEETYGLEDKEEYRKLVSGSHGSYCRRDLKEDIKSVIKEKQCKCIVTTDPSDLHGDHSALYFFVCEILKELKEEAGYDPDLFTGVIHSNAGDEIWPEREGAQFTCPPEFEKATGRKWADAIHVPVPDEMLFSQGEANLKLRALKAYERALEPSAYDFLMSFVKEEEIFFQSAKEETP